MNTISQSKLTEAMKILGLDPSLPENQDITSISIYPDTISITKEYVIERDKWQTDTKS